MPHILNTAETAEVDLEELLWSFCVWRTNVVLLWLRPCCCCCLICLFVAMQFIHGALEQRLYGEDIVKKLRLERLKDVRKQEKVLGKEQSRQYQLQ